MLHDGLEQNPSWNNFLTSVRRSDASEAKLSVASSQYENQISRKIFNLENKNRNNDSFGMQDTVVSETSSVHG